MTTQLLSPPLPATNRIPLRDIVEFAEREPLPPVSWLTRLRLDQPRVNVECLSPSQRTAKRIVDVTLAALLLIVLSPLMLLTAVLVKLTSPGPVIFRQTRVGLNLRKAPRDRRESRERPPRAVWSRTASSRSTFAEDRLPAADQTAVPPRAVWSGTASSRSTLAGDCLPAADKAAPQPAAERRRPDGDRRRGRSYGRLFVLYKFRTMRTDAERNGAQFAVRGDPRVTPIGRFLRRTRIDELPQLWNVLKGEMSLVGPRPERPEFIAQLSEQIPDYLGRLGLRPGLTGVAQIVNGYDNDIESFRRKVAFDLLYLQNCCLWNDLKVLLRTVKVVLTGSGAL
jgi:lipopolysaccharide/colanic/teichoic acid biosynthesis glycosyltransferase